ncbi:phosphoserine phosphatase, chloroplastic-like protein [Tanacetum coccineum]|uniref:Phosphoserine phosphatase, chloroplastic-like protein n=1 Tax=Tanacetum coccineum TaxID=301880 RepID=A0ABQ5B6B4_9ASTR
MVRALMNLLSFMEAGKLLPNGPLDCKVMAGSVSFEEALATRVDLFKPSLERIQDFLEKMPSSMLYVLDHLKRTNICSLSVKINLLFLSHHLWLQPSIELLNAILEWFNVNHNLLETH